MKDYHEMAESVLKRRDNYVAERRTRLKKVTAGISSLCICALVGVSAWQSGMLRSTLTEPGGTAIVPGGTTAPREEDPLETEQLEQCRPATTDDTEISMRESGDDPAVAEPNMQEDKIFSADGTPLREPVMMAADLTQEALYNAIGAYLPVELPEGFTFESASFSEYGYSIIWYYDLEELDWQIRDYKDEDAKRITSVADTKNYDLSLYPIPRADTVPDELLEIVSNPIFRAEDLTPEAVYARAYKVDDVGDSEGYRMHFSVLYGDKIVSVTSKGISPDWLYHQLSKLPSDGSNSHG